MSTRELFNSFYKRSILLLGAGLLLHCFSPLRSDADERQDPVSERSESQPPRSPIINGKKFKRAIALPGGNLNSPMHIAMYDAVSKLHGPIDVIIGNCGGALAAGIIAAMPDPVERLKWLKSMEFQKFLKQFQFNPLDVLVLQQYLTRQMRMTKAYKTGFADYRLMDLFGLTLIRLDEVPRFPALENGFPLEGPRIIIMATEMLVDPHRVVDRVVTDSKIKYFREVYFTDSDTAQVLSGVKAATALAYPDSMIAEDTRVITDATLTEGIRASTADPLLTQPAFISGKYFLTGAQNPDPVDLLNHLAETTYMRYTTLLSEAVETPVMYATFKYNPDMMRYLSYQKKVTHWIDMTETQDMPSFRPAADPSIWVLLGSPLAVNTDIPEDPKDFEKYITDQYNFTYARTVEALKKKPGSQKHIRKPIIKHHAMRF